MTASNLRPLLLNLDKIDEVVYSDIFEIERMIFFDTSFLVSDIEKVVYNNDFIALQCGRRNNKLLLKDLRNGKTIKIGNKGKGAGEYTVLTNFIVVNNRPVILDGKQGKVLIYSKDGKLEAELINKNLVFAKSFAYPGNNLLAVYGGIWFYGDTNHRLLLLDSATGSLVAKHFPIPARQADFMYFVEADNFTNDKLFHYKYNDTLYFLHQNEVKPAYHIDFMGENLPFEILNREYSDVREFVMFCRDTPYAYGVSNLFSLSGKLFFNFNYKKEQVNCLYNLEQGHYLLYNKLKNDLFGLAVSEANDYLSTPKGAYNNTLAFVVEPSLEKSKIEKLRNSLTDVAWQKLYKHSKEWIDMLDSMRYDSNDFIVIVKIKNDVSG